jgi:hypothetical protein
MPLTQPKFRYDGLIEARCTVLLFLTDNRSIVVGSARVADVLRKQVRQLHPQASARRIYSERKTKRRQQLYCTFREVCIVQVWRTSGSRSPRLDTFKGAATCGRGGVIRGDERSPVVRMKLRIKICKNPANSLANCGVRCYYGCWESDAGVVPAGLSSGFGGLWGKAT